MGQIIYEEPKIYKTILETVEPDTSGLDDVEFLDSTQRSTDSVNALEEQLKELNKEYEKNVIENSKTEGKDRASEITNYLKILTGIIVCFILYKKLK